MSAPSIFRRPSLLVVVLRHPTEFRLGWSEARNSNGVTLDDDPESDRSRAYDAGRDLRLWGAS